MKRILALVCCIALCSAPGFAQRHKAPHKTAAVAGPAMSDQDFVNFAAQTDMVEANLGQLAQDKASSDQVKEYGQMLATDHTNDFSQLHAAAQQANLTVPDAIDSEHNKKMIDPFQKLKGSAFDHKYIAEMVAGHTKAIAVYKKEANDAQNDAIKTYAQAALPTLEKHLDEAKALEKSGGKKK
ncbi:MAG TPA: DUF4142 domain-containing protein [Candidatus Angelobacter sp.]|nr:DUF4142 domain-containing protein [Candidatus Angelobacter sp.]